MKRRPLDKLAVIVAALLLRPDRALVDPLVAAIARLALIAQVGQVRHLVGGADRDLKGAERVGN